VGLAEGKGRNDISVPNVEVVFERRLFIISGLAKIRRYE